MHISIAHYLAELIIVYNVYKKDMPIKLLLAQNHLLLQEGNHTSSHPSCGLGERKGGVVSLLTQSFLQLTEENCQKHMHCYSHLSHNSSFYSNRK